MFFLANDCLLLNAGVPSSFQLTSFTPRLQTFQFVSLLSILHQHLNDQLHFVNEITSGIIPSPQFLSSVRSDSNARVEREVGGGIGMGNTYKSMADSCQCMTKTTTIL